MSDSGVEMPKYRCHKVVHALKIAKVWHFQVRAEGGLLSPAEMGYAQIAVSQEYMAKHNPQEGGYYVVYDDGYKSFSPAKAFEEGYTRI